jgi:hypothetical protein
MESFQQEQNFCFEDANARSQTYLFPILRGAGKIFEQNSSVISYQTLVFST